MKIKTLNKKGFTLIELLAVIVILGIILIIAVPQVLDIQKSAKKGTTSDQVLLIKGALEKCFLAEQPSSLNEEEAASSCSFSVSGSKFNNYFKTPAGGVIKKATISSEGAIEIDYEQNGWKCVYPATETNENTTCTQLKKS